MASRILFAVATLLLAPAASACIVAHTLMTNCIFGGDFLSAQVYDDGRKVCDVSKGKNWASDSTVYEWDENSGCVAGYKISLSHNGRWGTVWAANGYMATLGATDQQMERYQCGTIGAVNERPIWGTQWEACLSDMNGCAGGECHLCGYRPYC